MEDQYQMTLVPTASSLTRTNLSFQQRVQLGELLKTICHKTEDGYAHYDPGWNDVVAATRGTEKLGFAVTATNVRSVRASILGRTRVAPSSSVPASYLAGDLEDLTHELAAVKANIHTQDHELTGIASRIGVIERRIARVEQRLTSIEDALTRPGPIMERAHQLRNSTAFKDPTTD